VQAAEAAGAVAEAAAALGRATANRLHPAHISHSQLAPHTRTHAQPAHRTHTHHSPRAGRAPAPSGWFPSAGAWEGGRRKVEGGRRKTEDGRRTAGDGGFVSKCGDVQCAVRSVRLARVGSGRLGSLSHLKQVSEVLAARQSLRAEEAALCERQPVVQAHTAAASSARARVTRVELGLHLLRRPCIGRDGRRDGGEVDRIRGTARRQQRADEGGVVGQRRRLAHRLWLVSFQMSYRSAGAGVRECGSAGAGAGAGAGASAQWVKRLQQLQHDYTNSTRLQQVSTTAASQHGTCPTWSNGSVGASARRSAMIPHSWVVAMKYCQSASPACG
jgi:hypothetical protein